MHKKETNGHLNAAETSGASPPKLAELELKVTAGIWRIKSAFVEVGLALGEIKDKLLYKPLTFDKYLESKPEWGVRERYANRLIASAKVAVAVNRSSWTEFLPDVPKKPLPVSWQNCLKNRKQRFTPRLAH